MTNKEHAPESESLLRKIRYRRLIAGVALVAALSSGVAIQQTIANQRHTPDSAPYSRDANPDFYQALKTVQRTDATSAKLDALARQPVAEWLPSGKADAVKDIGRIVTTTVADKTLPIFVSYAIPDRDLGGHSAGGLGADGYKDYIKGVSQAIGSAPAIVVVEPDALAQLPDIKDAGKHAERVELLADAIDELRQNPKTAVYLDAGNSAWRNPGQTAGLLKDVAAKSRHGIPGIALNVSNYRSEAETRRYAQAVSTAYGKTLFTLIDNSRNGATPDTNDYCNPSGQRLGTADTTFDPKATIETAIIKTPGESDGACGISQATAGMFDTNLLLEQLGAR